MKKALPIDFPEIIGQSIELAMLRGKKKEGKDLDTAISPVG
jgi:hypothetical protein